jgi:uncharacterized protein DUF1592/uncharacterized protein DUF1588/uncharacterized protein DUF1595/uncharacterized protein DUF1585/uncharacterized protein DUF1587
MTARAHSGFRFFGGLAVSVALAGCMGQLLEPGGSEDSNGPNGSNGPGAPGGPNGPNGSNPGLIGGKEVPPGAFQPAPATLRRLTVQQYQNSIRDLVGDVTFGELEPDAALHGFASLAAAQMTISPRATELFTDSALKIAEQVFADPARRSRVASCDAAADANCVRDAITAFGRRAWRRPLSTEEVDRYVGLADKAATALGGDRWQGLQWAVAGLFQSANFLYRSELGVPDPKDASRRIFTDYELASRLSYFVWNTTPDDALLDAADRGELSTPAGLLAQAERLIASPRAKEAITGFFGELFQLDALSDLPQQTSTFPQMSATIGPAMREETQRFLTEIAFSDSADYRSIFDSTKTYVNSELAGLYGIPAPAGSGFVEVTLPSGGMRGGILGQGSFLAINAHATASSPTLRGKFIREVLLCQAIPPPPPDVVTDLNETAGTGPMTMRQKLSVHATNETCAQCHKRMDPIGLTFENFDGIGAFRTTDAGQVIDASGELDGVHVDDARGLATALKNHPDVATCAARTLYRYAAGHLETAGEQPLVKALGDDFVKNGAHFRGLLLGVVQSAGFRYAAHPQ